MPNILIARTGNEADIIEAFVQHHAELFDRLLIIDDDSTDGTLPILRHMEAEGYPLQLYTAKECGWEAPSFCDRLMHIAAHEYAADWIAPLDVDEFLEFEDVGRPTRMGVSGKPLQLRWNNFAWSVEEDAVAEANPVKRMKTRMPARRDSSKLLIPGDLVRATSSAHLTAGNHWFRSESFDNIYEYNPRIKLCHYPVRSVSQFAAKVITMHLRYSSFAGVLNTAFQYKIPFEILTSRPDVFASYMARESQVYALQKDGGMDGEPCVQPLRYLGGELLRPAATRTPFAALAQTAERLAEEVARLRSRTEAFKA